MLVDEDGRLPTLAMASQVPATKSSSQGASGGKPSNKKPLRADAGLIHGEDQYRGKQTILTAVLRLLNGKVMKVAIPNEGAGWRPGQREVAVRLGYKPLGGTTPGSDVHAEASLDAQIQPRVRNPTELSGARVENWAISRGAGGTSEICTGSCRSIVKGWPEPER